LRKAAPGQIEPPISRRWRRRGGGNATIAPLRWLLLGTGAAWIAAHRRRQRR